MVLFITIWFLLFSLSFSRLKNNTLLMQFWLILFAFLIGFRGEDVGVDTRGYIQIYEWIHEYGYNGYPEPLYGYINSFFAQMGMSFGISQFIMFLIAFEIYALIIRRLSLNKIFSVFMLYSMYFVFYSMNVSRQMLATSILLLAYYYFFHKRRIGTSIICVTAAAMIHISSIVSLGYLFINKINLEKKGLIILLLTISFALGAFFLNDNILSVFAGPYSRYIESNFGIRPEIRYLQSFILSLFWSILCFIITVTSNFKLRNTPYYKLYILSILASNLMMNLELGLRVVFCFSVIQIVFFPMYIENNILPKRNMAQLIISIFYGIFFFIFLCNNSAGILPYNISF